MRIRPALVSEAAELSALVAAAKQHWGYSAEQMEDWRAGLTITANYLAGNSAFVAERDDRTVGFYSLLRTNDWWQLDHLWVLPESMNKGIGRAMLAHAQSSAASGRAVGIKIDADPNAEAFYLACGAKRVGIIAAPISGFPDRIRPQLILPVAQSEIAVIPVAR